jgi:hypothetical protein
VAEFRSTTTTLNHGQTSHNTSTSGVNNNNAVDSETGIRPSIQSFLVKQTELMNQMMQHLHNNASGSQLVNKPSTSNQMAYDDESDQSSHGGNSSDEDDWTHSLDRITKMMRTDENEDEDEEREDLLAAMENFFKQEESTSGKIDDRLAKILNESVRIRIGENKKKELMEKTHESTEL